MCRAQRVIPVDSVATFKDRQYVLTDTAGIRRRGRVERGIEGL
jgi:GTP-binding protein